MVHHLAVFPLIVDQLFFVMATLVVWGFGIAVSNSLFLVLLIDVVGIKNYEVGVSVTCILLAFTSLVAGPILGDYICMKYERPNMLPVSCVLNFVCV